MISIVVPVYNGELYIKRLLNDFKNQRQRNFEVIFVDDGSTDNSYHELVTQKKQEDYSFDIKIYSQENKGVSSARNTGIDKAIGQYICFVDVDDRVKEDYLSHMYELIEKHDASLVFCKSTETLSNKRDNNTLINIYNKEEALKKYLYHELISGVCTLMIKRSILEKNQLRFKEGYHYSEDLHMVWRMIQHSPKLVETNRKLYVYLVNKNSAMGKFNKKRMGSIELMEDLEVYFKRYNPPFFILFKKYGKARVSWSVLWQAAYHMNLKQFLEFTKTYPFKNDVRKLFSYKQNHVKISSMIYFFSKSIYYFVAKIASINFRKIKKE